MKANKTNYVLSGKIAHFSFAHKKVITQIAYNHLVATRPPIRLS